MFQQCLPYSSTAGAIIKHRIHNDFFLKTDIACPVMSTYLPNCLLPWPMRRKYSPISFSNFLLPISGDLHFKVAFENTVLTF